MKILDQEIPWVKSRCYISSGPNPAKTNCKLLEGGNIFSLMCLCSAYHYELVVWKCSSFTIQFTCIADEWNMVQIPLLTLNSITIHEQYPAKSVPLFVDIGLELAIRSALVSWACKKFHRPQNLLIRYMSKAKRIQLKIWYYGNGGWLLTFCGKDFTCSLQVFCLHSLCCYYYFLLSII